VGWRCACPRDWKQQCAIARVPSALQQQSRARGRTRQRAGSGRTSIPPRPSASLASTSLCCLASSARRRRSSRCAFISSTRFTQSDLRPGLRPAADPSGGRGGCAFDVGDVALPEASGSSGGLGLPARPPLPPGCWPRRAARRPCTCRLISLASVIARRASFLVRTARDDDGKPGTRAKHSSAPLLGAVNALCDLCLS
jgi:hypothetical protein